MSVSHSPNSRQVASCGLDGTIRIWDIETESCIKTIVAQETKSCLSFILLEEIGSHQAAATVEFRSGMWRQVLALWSCLDHGDGVCSIVYSPTGHQIATGSMDNTLRLWDAETGNCLHTMTGHGNVVYAVTFSPNGDQLASGSGDETVRLWDISTGASRHISNCHSGAVMYGI
jgi:WD40 repeat protein